MVFVKTRQTCPSVSTGRRYYSRYRGARPTRKMSSWTVGQLGRGLVAAVGGSPLIRIVLVRPLGWRAETEEDRLVLPLSRRVSTVSVGCLYRVTGFVFGSIEWPIATRNVPPDFLWPPLTSFPGLRPISMIAGAKLIFPKHFGEQVSLTPRGPTKMPPSNNNNTLSMWKSISLPGFTVPNRQSEFIRVGSNREDYYHDFFSWRRGGGFAKNGFR